MARRIAPSAYARAIRPAWAIDRPRERFFRSLGPGCATVGRPEVNVGQRQAGEIALWVLFHASPMRSRTARATQPMHADGN